MARKTSKPLPPGIWRSRITASGFMSRMKRGTRKLQLPAVSKWNSGPSLIHKLGLNGVTNQFGRGFHPGLLKDARAIGTHRLHTQGDFIAYLFDGLTRSDHSQHLKLAI